MNEPSEQLISLHINQILLMVLYITCKLAFCRWNFLASREKSGIFRNSSCKNNSTSKTLKFSSSIHNIFIRQVNYWIWKERLIPLIHPNISMHIHQTVLYTFPKLLTRRICLKKPRASLVNDNFHHSCGLNE